MSHDLHHLAAAYSLDALDANERRAFEAHYPTCDVCVSEVADFRTVAALLAEGAAAEPPVNLKSRVMAEVAQTRQVSPILADSATVIDLSERRFLKTVLPVTLAAAAAIVVAMLGVAGVIGARMSSDPTGDLIAAPDAVVSSLEGETGTMRIVWSDERDQVAIFASDLADAGPGKAYALWFISDDGVAPAALFDGGGDNTRILLNVDDINPSSWGITIEPATGSPQPTGEILFLGSV